MSQRSGWIPPLLDVYAPKEPGSWPVVIMLHGFSMRKAWLEDWATQVAQRGAVVYVPDWGHFISFSYVAPIRSEMEDEVRDIAAIVRFARATSADYGGDAGDLTLFGHSAGAGEAAVEALSGAKPSEGILAGAGSAVPNRLVLFDGDFILGDPTWDTFLAADPGFMQTLTPWPYLGSRVDFPITILASEDPGLSRPLGDPWAEDSWFVVRDPSGDVRQGLKKLGLLKGDTYTIDDAQRLLAERLSADGDQVSYLTLPSSTHTELSAEGMESLVSALVPNAER
jgi:acetyl esterase/lipase